jgi:hypothetical protein
MSGFKLSEPIPIAEVGPIDLSELVQIPGGYASWYEGDRMHKKISRILGLEGIPLEPTRYLAEKKPDEDAHIWHTDGGEGFFQSPDICLYANTHPAQVIRGEIPINRDSDWKNLTEPNEAIEEALSFGTAEIKTLLPNVYYLLRMPAIHRGPGPVDLGSLGIRLSARWI